MAFFYVCAIHSMNDGAIGIFTALMPTDCPFMRRILIVSGYRFTLVVRLGLATENQTYLLAPPRSDKQPN